MPRLMISIISEGVRHGGTILVLHDMKGDILPVCIASRTSILLEHWFRRRCSRTLLLSWLRMTCGTWFSFPCLMCSHSHHHLYVMFYYQDKEEVFQHLPEHHLDSFFSNFNIFQTKQNPWNSLFAQISKSHNNTRNIKIHMTMIAVRWGWHIHGTPIKYTQSLGLGTVQISDPLLACLLTRLKVKDNCCLWHLGVPL